jgi:hypothetical protein
MSLIEFKPAHRNTAQPSAATLSQKNIVLGVNGESRSDCLNSMPHTQGAITCEEAKTVAAEATKVKTTDRASSISWEIHIRLCVAAEDRRDLLSIRFANQGRARSRAVRMEASARWWADSILTNFSTSSMRK